MSKSRRIALFGNVNTEEILAKKIQLDGDEADGYLFSLNDAFRESCRDARVLDAEYIQERLVQDLSERRYDALALGPIVASYALSELFRSRDVAHVGATVAQIAFEIEKTKIHEVFPEQTNVMPKTVIPTKFDAESLRSLLEGFRGGYVLKFVGDYGKMFRGSETGRVRFSGETLADTDEALMFLKKSIEVSGKAIVQERASGREFSANYVVDANGHLFRLGENICFKRRNDGNTGPICDGTGSISINNTLPFLSASDIRYVKDRIVKPFHSFVTKKTGQPFVSFLNVDAMKSDDGRILLFEINCREAGGHTMANLLSGLENRMSDVFVHAQNGTLDQIQPIFRRGASVVVSAFPSYFPAGTSSDDELMTLEVTKRIPDDVHLFTGWVDVLHQDEDRRALRIHNSPVLLFEHRNTTLSHARTRLYEVISEIVRGRLDYRKDLGGNNEETG
jgi:phosphoribosylamine-glycine ligase